MCPNMAVYLAVAEYEASVAAESLQRPLRQSAHDPLPLGNNKPKLGERRRAWSVSAGASEVVRRRPMT